MDIDSFETPSNSKGSDFSTSESSNESGELNVEVDISPNKDGKLLKTLIKKGKGWQNPNNGDKVSVHYVGKLLDGTKFDSSRDRNEHFDFILGAKQVIQGWDIAVRTMKRSEIASFKIDSSLAYGDSGSPPTIPPNATLVFEIELFDWTLEDITKKKDGGIYKRILIDGTGFDTPNKGATCNIYYSGMYEDKIFEEREVTFYLGEGSEENLVPAIEIAVRKMKKGEKCEIIANPHYTFGEGTGKPEFNIPDSYTELKFEILLKSFEKVKETYEMDNGERIEQANLVKTKGTKYFKESKFKLAIKQYKRVIQFIGFVDDFDSDLKPRARETLLAGYLNLAMCYLKISNFSDAQKNCEKGLEIDSKNEKGLFRRGLAFLGQNDYDLAKKDFVSLLEIDPTNTAAKSKILECNSKIKEHREIEKMRYKNMFVKKETAVEKDKPLKTALDGDVASSSTTSS
ncbi:hypothetical protein RDWZM_005848 [Blomia tropicalis]|uniref:peptidylprolyl isomerase n=1 Tax=Blomia tropicalis TaxID=40697 RepID=A0A9Q0M5Z6_BLOTA|nr:hypothetical protein RDWZM_005848 [Blomia tropicalis]